MPINCSAWCIISLVMRKGGVGDGLAEAAGVGDGLAEAAGVGDGLAEAAGVGDGVCASALSGVFVTTMPAAPAAGRSFTKVRRLSDLRFVFFMISVRRRPARSSFCLRLSAYCFLPTAFCPLPSAFCLLLSAFCLLLSAYCFLPSAY